MKMPCYGTPWWHFTCRSCPSKLLYFRGGSRNLVSRNVTIHKFLVKLQKEAFTVRHTTKELLTNQWRAGKWFQGNFPPEHRGTKMSDLVFHCAHSIELIALIAWLPTHPVLSKPAVLYLHCFMLTLFLKGSSILIQVISSQPIQLWYFYRTVFCASA